MAAGRWTFEEISLEQLEALMGQVEQEANEAFLAMGLRFYGDEQTWPCPYCEEVRPCRRAGTVELDQDGTPLPLDELVATAKKSWGFLKAVQDPLAAAAERFQDGILGGLRTRLEARVYECPQHGPFYIRWLGDQEDPFMPWQARDGVMVKAPPLVLPCMGMIRDESPTGETLGLQICWRLMKWWGHSTTPGEGEGGYACEIHGEQRQLLDPTFEGPFALVTRVIN